MTAARYFPLLSAGFRSNPFRALPDHEWAASAVLDDAMAAAFGQTDAHLQALGVLGAGKTTTLLGLGRLAQDAGQQATYLYIAEGQSRLHADIPSGGLLLLDEAQRLAAHELARVLDCCSSDQRRGQERGQPPRDLPSLRLALASHADLTPRFQARGLPLVSVSVHLLSLAGWRAFLEVRLAAAAVPGRPHATMTDDGVRLLAAGFFTDRRAAVAFLYEVFQALREPIAMDAALLRHALSGGSYGQRRSSIRYGV